MQQYKSLSIKTQTLEEAIPILEQHLNELEDVYDVKSVVYNPAFSCYEFFLVKSKVGKRQTVKPNEATSSQPNIATLSVDEWNIMVFEDFVKVKELGVFDHPKGQLLFNVQTQRLAIPGLLSDFDSSLRSELKKLYRLSIHWFTIEQFNELAERNGLPYRIENTYEDLIYRGNHFNICRFVEV